MLHKSIFGMVGVDKNAFLTAKTNLNNNLLIFFMEKTFMLSISKELNGMRKYKLLILVLVIPVMAFSQKLNPEGHKMVKELDAFSITNGDTCFVKYYYSYDENGRMNGMDVWYTTKDFIYGQGWGEKYFRKLSSFKVENGKLLQTYNEDGSWQKNEFVLDEQGKLVRWLEYIKYNEPIGKYKLNDMNYDYVYNKKKKDFELVHAVRKEAVKQVGSSKFEYLDPECWWEEFYDWKNGFKRYGFKSSGIKNDLNIPIAIDKMGVDRLIGSQLNHTEWFKIREEYLPQGDYSKYKYEFDEKGNLIKICSWNEITGYLIKYVD